MKTLFFYGTLCHVPLLEAVLGRMLDHLSLQEAHLPDHAVYWAAGRTFPVIVARDGASAGGLVVSGLSDQDVARLDFYEGGYDYHLREVAVETAQGPQRVQVYFPLPGRFTAGPPFALEDWIHRYSELTLAAMPEAMAYFGKISGAEMERRFPTIMARASARVAARSSAPVSLRHNAAPEDIEIAARSWPYTDYFAVTDLTLQHRRFDGAMSAPLRRAAFLSGDSATVLPYDAQRDRVLLIEQFRIGPLARGDRQCWLLEAIAGRIDPGESPEATVRREAQEEAGLTLGTLHRVQGYYPSPGALAEYITSFIGLADLPDDAAGLGGLESEHEDIRAHVVTFERCLELLRTGEIDNAPLAMSVMWLALNRDRLRAAA